MQLRHLRYFITLADELHFGKAANKLAISQPHLSNQIKQLEADLGLKLLIRTNQHVQLTMAGTYFEKRASDMIYHLEQSTEDARSISRSEAEQLTLAFAGATAFDLLPLYLKPFQMKYPKINITLIQLTTSEQMKAFNENTIHIGFVIMPVSNISLNIKSLHEEPFVVALHKAHPLAQRKEEFHLSDLKDEKFIMTPRIIGEGYYDSIISLCQSAGFSPKKAQEATELYTAVSFVAANMGVAILPSSIKFINNEKIVYLPIENNTILHRIGVAWHKTEHTPAVDTFISYIEELATND